MYIGRGVARGQNREIDDISSSFNGTLVDFNLRVSGVAVYPASTNQLFVSVGGVLQNPALTTRSRVTRLLSPQRRPMA